MPTIDAGWSSLVARRAHNPKVVGSNPAPATNTRTPFMGFFIIYKVYVHPVDAIINMHIFLFFKLRYMIQDELVQLLSPIIADLGYDLWGCEYLSQGKHSLLRIYIDKSTGIAVEDCERVSKQVNAILDVEDPIPGNYSLEISSPGIPRPLFFDWQYELYKGSMVQLKLYKPIAKTRKLSGVIISVTAETATLEIGHEHQEIQFSNIVKANLIV